MAMSSKMLVLKAEPKKIRQDWTFIFFKIGKSTQALIQIIKIGQTPQNSCLVLHNRNTWTARRSTHSILKEINPEYSLMLKDLCWSSNTLATWYKEPTHWKRPWCCKIEGKRIRGWHRMRWLNSITDSTDMYLSKLQEKYEDRGAWCATVHEVTKNRTRLVTEQ